jgi:hypothetical protein
VRQRCFADPPETLINACAQSGLLDLVVNAMTIQTDRLRKYLSQRSALIVPGAANALAARIIADLGFETVYLSGAGLTNTLLGIPDLAFVSLPELVQHTAAINEVVDLPLIVDADTGFGNAINVRQTVRALERAGADHQSPHPHLRRGDERARLRERAGDPE